MEGKDQRERMGSKLRIKSFVWILCMMLGCCIWIQTGMECYAAATADVVASEGRIREAADKSSKTLASVEKGDKLDVLAETKDGEGYTWYKVRIDAGNNGYIRADLVTVNGTIPTESTSSSESSQTVNSSETQSQTQETVVAVTVSETDVVSVKTTTMARIRKGAGTSFDSAGGIKEGITVPVLGVATGSDGKNWYQISYSENNQTIDGFIREDLVEVVERREIVEEIPEEAQPVEEETAVAEENQDYYVKFVSNESGESDWYLFNNIEGTSMSLTQMLSVIDQVKNKELKEADQVSNMRIIIFAMAAVLVVLVIVVTILIFKLRDSYSYEEYEDEEEEEEEEEEIRPIPEPKKIFAAKLKKEEEPMATPARDTLKRPSPRKQEEELPPVKAAKAENRSWQSKDFLELDDDMEFEFLDL